MFIASLIYAIRRYARYRSQLGSIDELDERTLRDIGISRGELVTTASRDFPAAISVNPAPALELSKQKARAGAGLSRFGQVAAKTSA